MLHLFKFIDSGFLLTLGLLLLIGGSVMLYCYRRLNLLERSIIEHGKILQNFIANYNIQMSSLCLLNNSGTSNYETSNYETSISDENTIKKINIEKKIEVSDDEDDGDDEDDEDDDEEDEEDDEDDEEGDEDDEEDEEDEEDDEDKTNIPKTINISESFEFVNDTNENNKHPLEVTELTSLSYLNSDDDIFIKNIPINLSNLDEDLENSSKVITLENNFETTQKVEKRNYSKMRIDDLRTLAVTKNLLDNESAQKMKKNDLVKLLHA
jgi:hypothetical protein